MYNSLPYRFEIRTTLCIILAVKLVGIYHKLIKMRCLIVIKYFVSRDNELTPVMSSIESKLRSANDSIIYIYIQKQNACYVAHLVH